MSPKDENGTSRWDEADHYHGTHTDNWFDYMDGPKSESKSLGQFDRIQGDEYRFLVETEISGNPCHPTLTVRFLPGMGDYGSRMLFDPAETEVSCVDLPQGINDFVISYFGLKVNMGFYMRFSE